MERYCLSYIIIPQISIISIAGYFIFVFLTLIGDGYCDDDNNNDGCDYDGGDCCGDNVNTQYCTACQCLDPNFGTTAAPPPPVTTAAPSPPAPSPPSPSPPAGNCGM